jgi:1,4-dihydroxy-2-naphthoate octaprenyltransferase
MSLSPEFVSATPTVRPGSWGAWSVALRPKTFWIAMIPVLVGTALAFGLTQRVDPAVAAIALVASLLMQVVTNLQNDVGYTERGGETGTRVGLPRATANGWLSIPGVKRAIVVVIAAAWLVSVPLFVRAGWPAVAMALGSTFAAWAYMGGPRPIAYTPLGEATVFVFFGLVAVCGTYYVQTLTLAPVVVIAATAIGLLAADVLLVNNTRDIDHDAATGRHTLAVVLARRNAMRLHALLVLTPFALTAWLAWQESAWLALPLVALPAAWQLVRDVATTLTGVAMNALLFRAVKLELMFGVLLAAGAIGYGLR